MYLGSSLRGQDFHGLRHDPHATNSPEHLEGGASSIGVRGATPPKAPLDEDGLAEGEEDDGHRDGGARERDLLPAA
jgi:hypothetical protein